jgi:mitochondrial intermediate peptidase
MDFLRSLSEANRPLFEATMVPMKEMKSQLEGKTSFQIWDRDYYQRLVQSHGDRLQWEPISQYFSVGTVMQGLSRLFSHLYGIKFVPKETRLGEVWHPDVRRLDFFDEKGHIGVMYCDIFHRPAKASTNPAHYTIRCSRRVDPHEEGTTISRDGYQLPVIGLICDFLQVDNQPSLLSWSEVTTLFHEMGHALHCSTLFTLYL